MDGRVHNSTLRRHAEMPRGKGPSRTGRIRAVNPERQAKKAKRYAGKLKAMKRGPGYAEALARAGGRCENTVKYLETTLRCPSRGKLEAHHIHYQRLGGDELASDLVMICKDCHRFLESQKPWRRRGKVRRG